MIFKNQRHCSADEIARHRAHLSNFLLSKYKVANVNTHKKTNRTKLSSPKWHKRQRNLGKHTQIIHPQIVKQNQTKQKQIEETVLIIVHYYFRSSLTFTIAAIVI